MYRRFDDSRAQASNAFWQFSAPFHLIFAAALFGGVIAATASATAAHPADPTAPYLGVYTGGDGPEHDKYISTIFRTYGHPYLIDSTNEVVAPRGASLSFASAAEIFSPRFHLNPTLHASVSGGANSSGNLTGGADASANASFRDILTIKNLPLGTSRGYPFMINFTYDGTLAGVGDQHSASQGWANVALNVGLYDLDQPNVYSISGKGLSTLPVDEAPVGSIGGVNGATDGELKASLNVKTGMRLMLEGSIDMYGNARGGDPAGAYFNADFGNSFRFDGIKIYADETLTTELTGYTIESALGFDYLVNVVPEPASLNLLASVGVLFGAALRRRLYLYSSNSIATPGSAFTKGFITSREA
ncbi:hypothetical protein [Lacipirellula sp.]|uniref:hypothetical protein n=1 Tax=Lacipirellula sp. TaxID=2691419 RepID=UPI003D12F0F4